MGYLKDKNTYITKEGKSTKRGLWANVYLKKKREGKLQEGGAIGGKEQEMDVYRILQSNSDKNFVQRILNHKQGNHILNEEGVPMTHMMSYDGDIEGGGKKFSVMPQIIQNKKTGQLEDLRPKNNQDWRFVDYAHDNNEKIDFSTFGEAERFTNEYKKGTLDKYFKQLGGQINPNNQQSILGYKDVSPYRNADSLLINSPTGEITMNGVSKDLIGIDEYGNKQYMKANSGKYKFKGRKITEIPVHQSGAKIEGGLQNPAGGGFMDKAMPYMSVVTGGLDLAMNWDKKDNTQKGQGIGSTAGNIAGNILLPGVGGQIGGMVGGLIGQGIGSAIPVDKEIEQPIYQNMRGIAVGKQGLKLNSKYNIQNNKTMDLRSAYDKYMTGGQMPKKSYQDGGLVSGEGAMPHSEGGVPTVDESGQQIAEVEGGERIFSIEDTQQMEQMAMAIQQAGSEEEAMSMASELGMFVVDAISRQEQVNPSEEVPMEEEMMQDPSMAQPPMEQPMMKKGGNIFQRP